VKTLTVKKRERRREILAKRQMMRLKKSLKKMETIISNKERKMMRSKVVKIRSQPRIKREESVKKRKRRRERK